MLPSVQGRMWLRLYLATVVAVLPVPQSVAPTGPLSAAQREADLQVFKTQFLDRDVSFASDARREAERRLAALAAGDVGSQLAFELELARIAALADNGHTHVVISRIAERSLRVPVRIASMGDQFIVIRAAQPHAELLGATLLAVNGRSITQVRDAARQLWGGTDAFRDQFAYTMIEAPEWLTTSGLGTESASATYRFQLPSGAVVERRLVGEPPAASRPTSPPGRTFAPEALPGEEGRWRTLLPAAQAPWALRDFAMLSRWTTVPEIQGLLLQLRGNADRGDHKIAAALSTFRQAIDQAKPRHVILDMRWNGGGDLNTTRDFMRTLPTRVPGRIVVLTGPLTFSAAIASVGYLKQAGGDRVTIVGEPMGDRLEFFAEGRPVELPASRVLIALATERHDYRNGCRSFSDCHRAVVRFPISVSSLDPDVPVSWTAQAYADGRDPAVEAAIRVLSAAWPLLP